MNNGNYYYSINKLDSEETGSVLMINLNIEKQ